MSTLAAHLESPNGRPRSRNLWRTYSVSGWISACTVGPQRLSVRDNRSRTDNVSESYHSALRRISNLFTKISNFHGHIQRATVDYMTDVARANNGLSIHRPKKKSNLLNEARIKACIHKFDSGAYDRLQFFKTVSHSLGAHTPSLHDSSSSTDDDDDDDDEVPEPPFPTDAAATAATAASTSSSHEVAHCCEVCLSSALITFYHLTF